MLEGITNLGGIADVPLQSDGAGAAITIVVWLLVLALTLVSIAGMWKVFSKAGEPGWGAIVPIYNVYLLVKIAGREWWWLLLAMIPFIGWIFAIIVFIDVAKSFGKGVGYGLGLYFLGFIFFPLLGFSDEEYLGPVTA